jgi:acyl carrier protein
MSSESAAVAAVAAVALPPEGLGRAVGPEEVLAEVRRIAAEELDFRGAIEPGHTLLRDLQLDSMGLTVMAVGLENHFRVRLTEEDSAGVATVGDLMRLVAQKASGGGQG